MRRMTHEPTYLAFSRFNPRYRHWRAFKRRSSRARLKQRLIVAGQMLAAPGSIAALLQLVYLFL